MCEIVVCIAFKPSKFELTVGYNISACDTVLKHGTEGDDLI